MHFKKLSMSWAATAAASDTGLTHVMTMPSAVSPTTDGREALSETERDNEGDEEETVEWLAGRGSDDENTGCDVA